MSKAMLTNLSEIPGQDVSLKVDTTVQNLQRMFVEVEPAVVELILEASHGDYDHAFAQLVQQQEDSRAVWGRSEGARDVRSSGNCTGMGHVIMPIVIDAESKERIPPSAKHFSNRSKSLPKPGPYNPPNPGLHRARVASTSSPKTATEGEHYLVQTNKPCYQHEGWAPHLSEYAAKNSAESKAFQNGMLSRASLPIENDVRCNRTKLELMDVGTQLAGTAIEDRIQGVPIEQPVSKHYSKNESSNGDDDGALRSLMEAFLGPSISLEDIARAYAACDGDVNAAANQLTMLSLKDDELPRGNVVDNDTDSGPLTTYQGKRTLEQSWSSDVNCHSPSDCVGARGCQPAALGDQSWGEQAAVPGSCPQKWNGLEGMPGLPPNEPSWQVGKSSALHAQEKRDGGQEDTVMATADFMYSMLGAEEGGVEMSTIRDLLDFFQGDAQKSLETLLNITNDAGDLDFTAPSIQSTPSLSLSSRDAYSPLMSLLECCPDVDPERAAWVLEEHNGDLEAAATALLQAEDVACGKSGMLADVEMVPPSAPPLSHARIPKMPDSPSSKANLQRLEAKFPTVEREVLRDVLSATSFSSASDLLTAAGFAPGPNPRPSMHAIMAEEKRAARTSRPHPIVGGASGLPSADCWSSSSSSEDEPSPHDLHASMERQGGERSYSRKWERTSSTSAAAHRSPGRGGWEQEGTWVAARSNSERKTNYHANASSGHKSEFERQREVSEQHYRLAKYFFHEANKEFGKGNKCYAMDLVAKGKEQNALAKEARRKASCRLLASRSMQHENTLKLDLHEQLVEEALEQLAIHLRIMSIGTVRTLVVITGQGRHSQGGIPRIKPAVNSYLQDHGIKWTEVNAGCIAVKYEDVVSANSVFGG